MTGEELFTSSVRYEVDAAFEQAEHCVCVKSSPYLEVGDLHADDTPLAWLANAQPRTYRNTKLRV